jgi:hypothetical protein
LCSLKCPNNPERGGADATHDKHDCVEAQPPKNLKTENQLVTETICCMFPVTLPSWSGSIKYFHSCDAKVGIEQAGANNSLFLHHQLLNVQVKILEALDAFS